MGGGKYFRTFATLIGNLQIRGKLIRKYVLSAYVHEQYLRVQLLLEIIVKLGRGIF